MQQPAVSVIIPMYNAQKYLGECLDSLLAQTLQNFEVIIVDDCSTDSSPAIVQSYETHFGGRLKLKRMKKNSGSGAEPRNKGLAYSRGEYVFFMDADDMLIPSGLDEMYALAKRFDADTVYCERYFISSGIGQDFINNVHLADEHIQEIPPVDVPTLETDDMKVRVNKVMEYNYWVTPWLKLVSRNLLIENYIKFPAVKWSEDVNWTLKIVFCSERLLRIPNPCYIWRVNEESITTHKGTTKQDVLKFMDRTIRTLKDLDDFMAGLEFFKKNPVYRYLVVNAFIQRDFEGIFGICSEETPFEVYNIFLELFSKYLGEHDVLVAGLCALVNMQQRAFLRNEQKFYLYRVQSKQRIDELESEINRLKERSGL